MTRAEALTELIFEVFRANGTLIAAGDALVADLGLTSARWQVLGAVALQETPAPVVRLADTLGLARQSVQRVVDDLAAAGLLTFAENPHHKRAKLVLMTETGKRLFAAASMRQAPWARTLAAGFTRAEIATAANVLARLNARIAESRR